MSTSPFFNQSYRPESRLYEEIIIEQIKAFGTDVYYLPRKLVKEDKLFGEDILSEFNSAYIIEMYYENESIGSGEADALTKFGLELRDEAKFQVSKLRFEQLISLDQNLISNTRPNEGDLIFFPGQRRKKLFEITFVEEEEFERLHNIPIYTISCKLFEYSNEFLDTGISDIDIIEDITSTNIIGLYDFILEDGVSELLLENNDNITFEEYTSIAIYPDSNIIEFGSITVSNTSIIDQGTFIETNEIEDNGDIQTESIILTRKIIDDIDNSSINEWLQIESDKIIDFTDSNPFGEI